MKRIDVAYALITDQTNTKILMVQNRDGGQWTLPGGAVEINETFAEAAIREAKEETGLDIRLKGVVSLNEYQVKRNSEHVVYVTFKASIIGGIEKINRHDEIMKISWVDVEQADSLMPYYNYNGLSEIVRKNVHVPYIDEGKF